ncbi:MAG: transglycosylase SLT domain-containing protein [Prevotella sp.]|nr:transglycosylase SLT domain-containing protein [Prevotella sp.]
MNFTLTLVLIFLLTLSGCTSDKHKKSDATLPWLVTTSEDRDTTAHYSLDEIMENGELIALTIDGPDTYYMQRDLRLGVQYLLCERFAKEIGVSVRVELCTDTMEMVRKLKNNEGDLIAMPINKQREEGDSLLFCGPGEHASQWAVMPYNKELAQAINQWYQPEFLAEALKQEKYALSAESVQRHVYAPVLNQAKGELSTYDHLFVRYAPVANVDWRLLAAIAYQESCFDPHARSWAGACGLMQLMPATAATYGLEESKIFEPELNVETAAKVINQLTMLFRDVPDTYERMNFVLASYNGGPYHVRDAMALTEKYGGDQYRWEEVSEYILHLSEAKYYRDPVVKAGYMRGTETHDYVSSVRERYEKYAGIAPGQGSFGVNERGNYSGVSTEPKRKSGKNKYQI